MIHTGDITHLSKVEEFDNAERIISQAKLDVHYVPGEHDFIDEEVKLYKERYGKGTKGAGWYSFDAGGVHFVGLVNVVNLKGGGLGNLGNEQLEWLEDDLKGKSKSTPIVLFAHIPLWTVYPQWGWGTEDGARALDYVKGFGSVTVLNGHIHQVMQKVEGNVTFHTARSTAFPQPAPGTAPSPGPMKVEDDKLRSHARRRQHQLQAEQPAARHHRHAAAGLKGTLHDIDSGNSPQPRPSQPRFAAAAARSCAPTRARAEDIGQCTSTTSPSSRQQLTVKVGTTVTWTNRDDIPHTVVCGRQVQVEDDGYRRQLLVHVHDGRRIQVFLFAAPAYDRDGQG